MKQTFACLFVLIVGLVSCNPTDSVTISKDRYRALTHDSSINEFSVNGVSYSISRGSDGHQYYMVYIATGGYTGVERPFHLPSCDLCKKYDKAPNWKN